MGGTWGTRICKNIKMTHCLRFSWLTGESISILLFREAY